MLKQKHSRLYQFNFGSYPKLERQKLLYLKDSSPLEYFESVTVLDLSVQQAEQMPPLNTLQFYFSNLTEINLSYNKIEWIDPVNFCKACPKIQKLDVSYNLIGDIKQIHKLKTLLELSELNIIGNPIDIIKKRLCLLESLLLDNVQPLLTEKQLVDYLVAPYSHVQRLRPGTAILPQQKKVFPNCTDDYNYQRDVLRHVTIQEKELQGIMRMGSITPRSGGNFKNMRVLNNEEISVKELQDVLYYEKFPKDYERQREKYRQQQIKAQDDYQKTTLKKASEQIKKPEEKRPMTSKQRKPVERFTNKIGPQIDLESLRPETVFRFVFQDEVNSHKQLQSAKNFMMQDPLEVEGERKRLKEQRIENKKESKNIKETIVGLKKEHAIKTMRFREHKKPMTYHPVTQSQIPAIQIQAKNVQQDMLDDIFKKDEVKKVESKGKVKIMKRLRQEQQLKLKNDDLLNQSFNSADMNERKDSEHLKLTDLSSDQDDSNNQDHINDSDLRIHQQQKDTLMIIKSPLKEQDQKQIHNNNNEFQQTQHLFSKQQTLSPSSNKHRSLNGGVGFRSQKTMMRCFSNDDLEDKGMSLQERGEVIQQKEIDKQTHISKQRRNFSLMAGRAYHQVYKKKDFQEAKKILSQELFKGHTKYTDLKSSNLRMEYIELMRNQDLFQESQDYFKKHKEFIESNPYYKEFFLAQTQNEGGDMNTYEDMILLYLNCKQNEHKKQDVKKLRQVVNKVCPTDPDTHYKHKKRNVIERIDRDLVKMSDQEFTRLQKILNLYCKLDSFPPSIKNFDKWLEINRQRQQRAIDKEEEFKRHVESLPQTKMKREQSVKEHKENKRALISLQNTIKIDNNYFLSPKHYQLTSSQTTKNLLSGGPFVTQQHYGQIEDQKQKKKLSHITKVGFIEKQMNQPPNQRITSKQIIEEWEPLDMKGSIVDYIPQYNKFWNELKQKVFPLGSLEQILRDPTKYQHTKQILQQEIAQQEKLNQLKRQLTKKSSNGNTPSAKQLRDYDSLQKKVIGSKYRMILTNDHLYEEKKAVDQNNDKFDVSLYLEDQGNDSSVERKGQKISEAEKYERSVKKGKMQKAMEKEADNNPIAHRQNMLKRIVSGTFNKYA